MWSVKFCGIFGNTQNNPEARSMKEILYIEDNAEMAILVRETLKPHQVYHVSSLKDADFALSQKNYDLILLDLGLPDGDGLKYIAEKYSDLSLNLNKTPLFILSAQNEVSNKVMAFAIGVDDYILKPFHQAELKARVEAKLRKNNEQTVEQEVIHLSDVRMDLAKQKVTVNASGNESDLRLTRLEFKLLTKFMKSPDRVFTREYLIENIWGDSTNITDRTVDTHIAHLRKKIHKASLKIETVTGEGYRLTVQPLSYSRPAEFPT
jgi:DNA-binding response OmpR family regulator